MQLRRYALKLGIVNVSAIVVIAIALITFTSGIARGNTASSNSIFMAATVGAFQDDGTQAEHARAERQLQALQNEIQQRRRSLEQRQQRLSSGERELRNLETQVQSASRSLRETELKIASVEGHIYELEQEQSRLQTEVETQAAALADQIESAYRNGDHGFLKLLLNQDNPARFERMLEYYQYLSAARLEQLAELHALETQLIAVREEVSDQRDTLTVTLQQQEQQRSQLANRQREQEQLVARLQREQQTEQSALQNMLRNEQELTEMLAALQEIMSRQDFNLTGLANLRGQLSWPTPGSIKHGYGSQRSGEVRWRGVVIEATAEAPVKAIADGRIIFSDWLRGFGMVVIIDHGENYMSLYGYNQALLKDIGEPVRKGETVALAGRSGGQAESGLYFEIRHEGNPINPTPYISR
ncbi:membrane-bound metallopeptidase [Idiomarina sp. A28L]|uniref:murein hydrolase activator EnvC family protein n=1 Tax=Idiomarina sp. A28L TaxID=1036674 RepID=UPI000213894B|nr:peptidoglycan DD-metalloendopeptidase family protein [Idiomarina sp. A28L]EGN74473.1 membrane-bound metallopeptidase [Idiomarina sp. A28L]